MLVRNFITILLPVNNIIDYIDRIINIYAESKVIYHQLIFKHCRGPFVVGSQQLLRKRHAPERTSPQAWWRHEASIVSKNIQGRRGIISIILQVFGIIDSNKLLGQFLNPTIWVTSRHGISLEFQMYLHSPLWYNYIYLRVSYPEFTYLT